MHKPLDPQYCAPIRRLECSCITCDAERFARAYSEAMTPDITLTEAQIQTLIRDDEFVSAVQQFEHCDALTCLSDVYDAAIDAIIRICELDEKAKD